jgi:hypothetical protein
MSYVYALEAPMKRMRQNQNEIVLLQSLPSQACSETHLRVISLWLELAKFEFGGKRIRDDPKSEIERLQITKVRG